VITASDVAAAVREALPAVPRPATVDGFLDGNPATPVTGVAVTMAATLGVLRAAVREGANLVITHEPLYFDHHDAARDALAAENDPVYRAKRELVRERGLVVWHLHDQQHDTRPDGVDSATAAELGWTLDAAEAAQGIAVATVEPITLGNLARHVGDVLGARALRYVGDPGSVVTRVGLDLGFRGFARNRALLRRPDVDVVVCGEVHEWETGGYAVDAVESGLAVGLVAVGHVPSEQAGSRALAAWLPSVVPGVPVVHIPTPDTFRVL
jgi:putative NIF3 family GTP cyclohydrolase 1 type 2